MLLADYFLDCYARKYKKKIGGLTRDAKTKLQSYAWPGNVRELQHAIERAVILSDGPMLRPENFMLHPAPAQKKGEPEELNLGVLEKEAIERALRRRTGISRVLPSCWESPVLPCTGNWISWAYETICPFPEDRVVGRAISFNCLSAFEGIVFYGCHVFYNLAGNCFFPLSGSAENASEDGASDCQHPLWRYESVFSYPFDRRPEANLTRAMNEALSAFRTRLYNVVVAEAETEAWQKLIRVLTHEIMNSIAPIISLSETVTERASSNGLTERDYSIMLQAMQTIHRRSKGLLDFVENYRKLTRIPVPMQQLFPVSSLFDDLRGLYPAGAVSFSFSVRPVDLRIYADRAMIEQVLINLLKNAVEACQERSYPEVRVNAFRREGVPVITVSDNGYGIVPEAMDKVFVPFFTTKQGGSGIGLSVCRQIMNRHGGSISVISEEEKGTTFTLQFPQTRVL